MIYKNISEQGAAVSDKSPKKRHEFALTAFILGVVSIVIPILVPCAIVALVLGSIAIHQINKDPEHLGGMGLAIAGVAAAGTSIFYLILVLIAIIIPLLIGDDNGTEVEQIQVHVRLVQPADARTTKPGFTSLTASGKRGGTGFGQKDTDLMMSRNDYCPSNTDYAK